MGLVLFFALLAPQAQAQLRCAEVFQPSTIQKILSVAAAPAKSAWGVITYTEVPAFTTHPIYQEIEEKVPALQSKAMQTLLYYSANGARKIYNAVGERGLGLPLPQVKTEAQIEKESAPPTVSKIQTLLEKYKSLKLVQVGTKKAYQATVVTATLLFSLHTMGNVAETVQSKPVYIESSRTVDSAIPLRDDQIQILNETTPFPHMAIRIGNMVYSHGMEALTQMPVDLYLRVQLLQQLPKDAGTSAKIMSAAGKQRVVDSVVLNLDKETVLRIRDQLLSETNKDYKNKTFVNSCSSMVVRVLKEEGIDVSVPFLDASPSMVLSQLALQNMQGALNKEGKPLVDGVYDLHYSKNESRHVARDFLVREIEGGVQLQIYSLPFRAMDRVQMNLQNPNLNDFYKDNPELQKALNNIRAQAKDDLDMIQEYDMYSIEKDALVQKGASAQEISELGKKYGPAFDQYIQQYREELKNTSLSYSDYYLTQYKIEFLEAAKKE